MTIAIMQPYFFPYIGYFQAIQAVDKYILYDDLNYIYQGWVDRNRLVDKGGNLFYIRPQLSNASVTKLISEINLQPTQYWKGKLLKTLQISYAGAAYFDETIKLIKEILSFETLFLSEFNIHSIQLISNHLNITTFIEKAHSNYKLLEEKLREEPANIQDYLRELNQSSLEVKVIRAIKICQIESATTFINAIGGKELYDKNIFKKYDINLKFIQTDEIYYKQFGTNHFSNLSIIDVLMHNGKEQTKKILHNYQLI